MAEEAASGVGGKSEQTRVVLHPLVLLSVVDHYNRAAKDTKKRVVGVLLGSSSRGTIDCTNSFGVPFEEDLRNPNVYFLDHNYLETMFRMYKKVNARERIVGFYSTGPKIKENDIKIDAVMRRFCPNPAFVIIDVRPHVENIPTTAYLSVEEVESDGKEIQRSFKHIPSSVGAYQAEEVGVEHLLRDVNDPSVSTLANQIKHKTQALAGLKEQLMEMKAYLENVTSGRLPVNNQIIYNMQTVFNLLPNLNIDELIRSLIVKTNDMHLVIYLSSLIRCIIALHDLVKNKIKFKDADELKEMGDAKDAEEKPSGSKKGKTNTDSKTDAPESKGKE